MLSSQFTDTIRANFDNFNSKLSIPINIKNYDDINISKVENYYCNGNSLTFQPHIYNYKIAYWRVVKSIEIEISGQSDDYAQVIVNNSITVHPNLQDTLGIKDGIYIWGKTQSSDYVKEKHPFTMTNENLNIQFGTVNTLPTVCYLKASLKIRLFFQFTNTVKTSVSTFSANLNNSIQLVNIYTIKGSNVAECHVFDIVDVWKLLYILNISVKSNNIEKAYITATLTAEGDDEFIFKLNNSYNMSLPSNAGSCMTCSACGNYTNFYKNSTKTFDVTQYLQDTNSIYVYFHNFTGGYSYKISNLEFTIKTYSKLQFTNSISPSVNSLGTLNKTLKVVLKTVFTTSISNIYSKTGRCEGHCYWEFPVISLNATILSQPENYSKEVAKFSLYGKADDGFKFNINGVNVASFQSRCTKGNCTNKSDWIASVHSYDFSLQSQTNNLLIKAYSIKNDYWAEIYSAVLTVETTSKQFTGTINVLSNKNSVSLKVKRLESFYFRSALPSGACGQTASLNKSFRLSPYIEAGLIKSITVTSNFDDYGSASINGITVGSCNLGGYHSCYDQNQTSVIDKSNLKNINSLSAYATSWNDPFGACASNGNGTGVNVTIKINYY